VRWFNLIAAGLVVIDNDLAAVVIDIPIVIALLDDDGIAVAVIVAVTNHFALANDLAVTMSVADRHADRTHTYADFIRSRRQRYSDKCGSRYNSKIQFHWALHFLNVPL
jgi:hypothetical protein